MNTNNLTTNRAEVAKSKAVTAMDVAKAALTKGFDTKAGQKEAMEVLRRAADTIKAVYQHAYLSIAKEANQNQKDFYWDFPDLHVWKEKHVAAANAAHHELSELANLMTALASLRNELKAAPVVKAPTKAEAKVTKLAEPAKAGNLEIMRAELSAVRDDVVTQYARNAQRQINTTKETLAASHWNVFAAFSDEKTRQVAYRIVKINSRTGECEQSAEMEAQHIEFYKKHAESAFEGFIAKMTLKLGEKSIASISCRGAIWDNCTITVSCADGSKVIMRTRIIVNTSKHGKLFNQWPTRIKVI